jgi:hypothetical protein
VLERAHVSSPHDRHLGEDERSGGRRGTINEGRGRQQWKETTTTMTMQNNYINIKNTLHAYLIETHVVPRKLHSGTLIN